MNVNRRNWLNDMLTAAAKDGSLDLKRATEVAIIEMSLALERIEQKIAPVATDPLDIGKPVDPESVNDVLRRYPLNPSP